MPVYEFICDKCKREVVLHKSVGAGNSCPWCNQEMKRQLSACAIIFPSNIGKKLRTRVALDDELKILGLYAPLYGSESQKDVVRWRLKKEGVG